VSAEAEETPLERAVRLKLAAAPPLTETQREELVRLLGGAE
jgi:hypothetical protein